MARLLALLIVSIFLVSAFGVASASPPAENADKTVKTTPPPAEKPPPPAPTPAPAPPEDPDPEPLDLPDYDDDDTEPLDDDFDDLS